MAPRKAVRVCTPAVMLSLITAVATVAIGLINLTGQVLTARTAGSAAAKAEIAAGKVEIVRTELQRSGASTTEKLDEIHTLVNSQYGIALALNADNARFKADKTKTKEDIEAAELAEKLYHEHRANQGRVDNKAKGPP